MHLTTTNPVSGVWRQNTRAGVIPAISFTRLSRRNARISAHAMRMRAYVRICAHGMRMRAYARIFRAWDANARICAHFAHAMRMLAHARISPHAMRCDAMRMRACDAMRMRASRGNLCVSGTVSLAMCVQISEKSIQCIFSFRVYTKSGFQQNISLPQFTSHCFSLFCFMLCVHMIVLLVWIKGNKDQSKITILWSRRRKHQSCAVRQLVALCEASIMIWILKLESAYIKAILHRGLTGIITWISNCSHDFL